MSSLTPLWITLAVVCVAIGLSIALPLVLRGTPYVDTPDKPLPEPAPIPPAANGPSGDVPLTKVRVKLPSAPAGQVLAVTSTLTEAYALISSGANLKLAYWQGSSSGTWTLINQLLLSFNPGPYSMSSDETGVMWCAGGQAWQAFLGGGSLGAPVELKVGGRVTRIVNKSLMVDGAIRILGDSPGVISQVWNPTSTWGEGPGWDISDSIVAVADGSVARIYVYNGISWSPSKSIPSQGGTIVGLSLCLNGRILIVSSSAGVRIYKWSGASFTGGASLLSLTGIKSSASDEDGLVVATIVGNDMQVRYTHLSDASVADAVYTVREVGSDAQIKFYGRLARTFIPGTVEWNETMT